MMCSKMPLAACVDDDDDDDDDGSGGAVDADVGSCCGRLPPFPDKGNDDDDDDDDDDDEAGLFMVYRMGAFEGIDSRWRRGPVGSWWTNGRCNEKMKSIVHGPWSLVVKQKTKV
jgi:hypothetical protein